MMSYFSSTFHDFFKNLAANNNREWFNDNKPIFEKEVKQPFFNFTEKVMTAVKKIDANTSTNVKDAVFRIYRDIRFSKDKTPYKLHMAAVISKGGRKDYDNPKVYYHLGPGSCFIGSGFYFVSKELLAKFRKIIVLHPTKVKRLLNDKHFLKFYPTSVLGEKNKILPKEFKEEGKKQPLLFNKQFYYMTEYNDDLIYRKDLVEFIVEHYKAAKNWNEFLLGINH